MKGVKSGSRGIGIIEFRGHIAHAPVGGLRNGKWCPIDEVNLEELADGFEKGL